MSRGVDHPLDKSITQRTILGFISSVIDPIGLVAPYTVMARPLLKDFWRVSGQKGMMTHHKMFHSGLSLC